MIELFRPLSPREKMYCGHSEYVKWLERSCASLRAAVREARRTALMEAAKEICGLCRANFDLRHDKSGFFHTAGGVRMCPAREVHTLVAKEQDR
jgi:hypothetical protein